MLIGGVRLDERNLTDIEIAKAVAELKAELHDREEPRRSERWWEVYRTNDHGETLVGIVGCIDDAEAQEVASAEWAPRKVEVRPARTWVMDFYFTYGLRFGSPHLGGWKDPD